MRALFISTEGATAIEYAMIALFVSVIAIAAFTNVATAIDNSYFQLFSSIPR